MKTMFEYLIVAVIAVAMAFVGYWLMGMHVVEGMPQNFIDFSNIGWTIWSSVVSIVTWQWLYRMCRNLHWLVLPVMGVFSPIIGAVLFFIPYIWMPFIVLLAHAVVIFPTGIACGFLISLSTLPFRPKQVMLGNA